MCTIIEDTENPNGLLVQNVNGWIKFIANSKIIGKLSVDKDGLQFDGDAGESSKLFLRYLKDGINSQVEHKIKAFLAEDKAQADIDKFIEKKKEYLKKYGIS